MNAKPSKQIVPLAVGLAWTGAGLTQQKLDGRFATLATVGGVLAGENVSGMFTAFDCIGWQGQDVRQMPLRERLAMRNKSAAPPVSMVVRNRFAPWTRPAARRAAICRCLAEKLTVSALVRF